MDGLNFTMSVQVRDFVNNLNTAGNATQTLDQSVNRLSTNISRNVANINRQNIRAFEAMIRQGTTSLNQLSVSVPTVTANVGRFTAAVQNVNFHRFRNEVGLGNISLQRLGTQAVATAGQMSNTVNPAMGRATSAMTDLGRVAQDAPFGFIAISNNLNPLLESFQRLYRETGTVSGSLKALGGALMGAGGLGLALSAFTAIQSFAIMGFRAWTGSTKKAKEAAREWAESLDAVTRSQLYGDQAAQKDLVTLKALYGAYQDSNVPLDHRQRIYKQLQDMYPDYFKNIKFEEGATAKAAESYDRLAKSILASARAKAAVNLITKNQEKLLLNEYQLTNAESAQAGNKKYADSIRKEAELRKKNAKNQLDAKAEAIQYNAAQESLYNINKRFNKAEENWMAYKKKRLDENAKLNAENLALEKSVRNEIIKGGDLVDRAPKNRKDKKDKQEYKSLKDIQEDLRITLLQNEKTVNATFSEKEAGRINAYQGAINELLANGFKPASAEVIELQQKLRELFDSKSKREIDTFFTFTLTNRTAATLAEQAKEIRDQAVKSFDLASVEIEKRQAELLQPDESQKQRVIKYTNRFKGSDDRGDIKNLKKEMSELGGLFDQGFFGRDDNAFDRFRDRYNSLVADLRKAELTDALRNMTNDFMNSGVMDIAESIGNAFVNGGDALEASGMALLGAFGKFLSGYGDLLIKYGAAAIVKGKLDLAVAVPGGGIFAGAALIAAGIALKVAGSAANSYTTGMAKKSKERTPTAFANGGIISGPTYALMGEYSGAKNNPEVVAPLSKLKSMIADSAGGGGTGSYTFTLEGRTLKAVLDRENRISSRI